MKKRAYGAVAIYVCGFVVMNLLLLGGFYLYPSWTTTLQELLQALSPVESMTLIFIIQEAVLLLLLRGAIRYWKPGITFRRVVAYFKNRGKRKGWYYVRKYVLGGLVVYFLLNVLIVSFTMRLGIEIPGMYGEQMVMTMLEEVPLLTGIDYLLVVMLVTVIGPAIEELIYRGFMTDLLMKKLGLRGVVLAAGLFAIAHLEWGVVLNLFLLALFLGYIYYKTESMRYSFLFHLCINGLAMSSILLARLYPEMVTAFIW